MAAAAVGLIGSARASAPAIFPVLRHEHDGLSRCLTFLRPGARRGQTAHALFFEKRGMAHHNPASANAPGHAGRRCANQIVRPAPGPGRVRARPARWRRPADARSAPPPGRPVGATPFHPVRLEEECGPRAGGLRSACRFCRERRCPLFPAFRGTRHFSRARLRGRRAPRRP